MQANNLPAGLDANPNKTEIFVMNGNVHALYKGKTIGFWDLPEHITNVLRREMRNRAHFCHSKGLDVFTDERERLERYVAICYGQFDNVPDFENGLTVKELQAEDYRTETGISERETEVMALISEGKTDKEIAKQLFISSGTVACHRHSLMQKTGSRNSAELTNKAIKHKILV